MDYFQLVAQTSKSNWLAAAVMNVGYRALAFISSWGTKSLVIARCNMVSFQFTVHSSTVNVFNLFLEQSAHMTFCWLSAVVTGQLTLYCCVVPVSAPLVKAALLLAFQISESSKSVLTQRAEEFELLK